MRLHATCRVNWHGAWLAECIDCRWRGSFVDEQDSARYAARHRALTAEAAR